VDVGIIIFIIIGESINNGLWFLGGRGIIQKN